MFDQKRRGSVVVGYDLSDEYAQISYCRMDGSDMNTVSLSRDVEQYCIPVCLFKRSEVNQWFAGAEAVNYSEMDEGELVWDLWSKALIGDKIRVISEEFDPLSLLTLYVKRTLNLLTGLVDKNTVAGLMFTVPDLSPRAIEVLNIVTSAVDFEVLKAGFLSREESIFYYVTSGERDLWKYDVAVFDYHGDVMDSYRFFENKITKPVVAFVEKTTRNMPDGSDDIKDEEFLKTFRELTDGHVVTCGYLIGDGFNGQWCRESLKELCRNRRTFRGNNLYSRGACFAMIDRLRGLRPEDKDIVFLGRDKLKANIGMDVVRKGKDSYLALLNGGDGWFDAKKTVDIILDKGNSFTLTVTPLDGRNVRKIEIVLDGLKEHEPKTVRIRLEAFMESEDCLRINMTDLGFGEFSPGSDQLFTQKIQLSDNEKEEDA